MLLLTVIAGMDFFFSWKTFFTLTGEKKSSPLSRQRFHSLQCFYFVCVSEYGQFSRLNSGIRIVFLELTGDYNIEYDRNYQRNEKLYDRTD